MQLPSCYFVGKQSVPDVPPLEDEDDDCEDDEKENAREENKITACLPYHISIPIPNNRNFCDITFRHGCTVGSLLDCDADPYPSDGSQYLMDTTEHNTELDRPVTLDSTGPLVDRNGAGDHIEQSMVDNTEHIMEHTPGNAGPTTEHTQGHSAEHQMEQSVIESSEDATRHTKCDTRLSIDEYLQLCVEHLNFSEIDVMFARSLYDTICHAGVMGIPKRQLEQVHNN